MSKPDNPLPSHWQYYAERAREAHLGYADDFGQGREELLHETLKFIRTGDPFTDERRASLDRVPHNRAKKHRRLRLYMFGQATLTYFDGKDDPDSQLIDRVHESLSPSEWEVECRLAEGESYAAIAASSGVSPDALKMRVSRWRTRVREKLTA
jgi:DNA-directed RNA polymerase specialized sigma24 family protein